MAFLPLLPSEESDRVVQKAYSSVPKCPYVVYVAMMAKVMLTGSNL
jgi:hypothetical protein